MYHITKKQSHSDHKGVSPRIALNYTRMLVRHVGIRTMDGFKGLSGRRRHECP